MDPRFPHDVDFQWSWPFPASRSLSTSDDWEEGSVGRKFASTGSIPILLFDIDDDDVGDRLAEPQSDSASLSPRSGTAAAATTTDDDNNRTGYRGGGRDRSSAILKLGNVGSSAAADASSEELRAESSSSPSLGGKFGEGGGLNYSSCRSAVDGRPSSSSPSSCGSADEVKNEWEGSGEVVGPSSRRRSIRPSCSRSSCLGQGSAAMLESGIENAQRTCYSSCCGSRASITNAPLIAPAKHTQNFALEHLPISLPSSNSFSLYGSLHQPHPPLTFNRHHRHHPIDHQHRASGASSPALSSSEADLSIDFPPRGHRIMDHCFPPPYSPSIEPSSSSSSSNSSLPHDLTWLQDLTVSLCIDQESFRTVLPAFKLVGYTKPALPIHRSRAGAQDPFLGGNDGNSYGSPTIQQHRSDLVDQASTDPDAAGMADFMPLAREAFVFHHSTLDPPPSIRRLSVNGDESRDYLSQYAYLTIKSSGGFQVYVVRGSETRRGGSDAEGEMMMTTMMMRPGRSVARAATTKLEWRFEYAVEDKRKADGTKAGGGEKLLTPLRFSCSPELLHPRQGRKVTVLSVWKKSIQPRVLANRLEPLTISSPTTSHKLTSPLSSPTSPKGVGVGGLRFPSASRLWGKRAKNSPYPFDKGSDGSEEELIPSEGSANRRRRRRPTSAYVSRASLEAEWPNVQMWDRDRGQSADAVWQTNRDARPATAGVEGSRGRGQSFGRGAASEGENERVSSRHRPGHPTTTTGTRHAYNRRPRTAR